MVMVTAMAMGTATATTEVMESRVVFKHCADALVRGLGPRLTPELKNKFIQLGIGADGMALPAIEYQRWNEILGTVAHDLMPELSAQDAYRLWDLRCDVREALIKYLNVLEGGMYLPRLRSMSVEPLRKSGPPVVGGGDEPAELPPRPA